MKINQASIKINSHKLSLGSKYGLNTKLSHENGLKLLIYALQLMDAEEKAVDDGTRLVTAEQGTSQ